MKAKTIKTVLRKKVDEWLETIEDDGVRTLAEKNVVVTGGCIASMLLNEKVNDFDVYFRNWQTTLAVARYYVQRFDPGKKKGIPCRIYVADEENREISGIPDTLGRIKIVVKSAGVASEDGTDKKYKYFETRAEGEAAGYVAEVMDGDVGEIQDTYEQTEQAALDTEDDGKPKYRPVFMSTNAITLSNRIQIVIRFWGEPDKIHENYDFAHCTNYWTSHDGKLVLRPDALEALLTKELRYVGSRYPLCSLIRIRKFVQRGWSINAGQILKSVMQLQELNLRDIRVLEDQLTGVDQAYFLEVLEKVRANNAETVNSAYLIEIIDRMF